MFLSSPMPTHYAIIVRFQDSHVETYDRETWASVKVWIDRKLRIAAKYPAKPHFAPVRFLVSRDTGDSFETLTLDENGRGDESRSSAWDNLDRGPAGETVK